MSSGGMSAENVLTSKSEEMDVTNLKETTDELEVVYSHIKNNTQQPEQVESVNLVESSLKNNSENDQTTDRLGMIAETDSTQDNAVVKFTEIPLSDSVNKVECLEVLKTNVIATERHVNDSSETINLRESTFGLITQNLNNSEKMIQNDIASAENSVIQLDESVGKSCMVNLENNLLTGKKEDITVGIEKQNTVNSLSCLATAYASSESDEDKDEYEDKDEMVPSPCEIITIVDDCANKTQNKTQYRTKPTENDSASEDTDSDSDSSDKSDSSDSDSESESDSEVEDGPDNISKAQPSKIKKTKSEFEDLPPIEELKITVPEELCDRLGEVSGFVEQLVIVRPISGKPTLNLDSILFLEKGHRVLGQVFDVFGQVADPHYCVRFNSEEHIKQSGIVLGMEVYYSPSTEHTSLVFLHELVKLKGIDVSGEDDIEPPEFSDDEEERAYNQLQRQKQRQKPGNNERQDNSDSEGLPQKRQCPERQRNPWSSDWQSRNYNNPRPNRNFSQGPPRWNPENSQPPFHNSFSLQNPVHPPNQRPPNQYEQPNNFNASQYQFNPYNQYQQNNMFPPPNPRYAFGRPPGFRPDFNNYGPNLYRPNAYPPSPMFSAPPPPPMSWAPPPPPT